jgi:hypothetical protein
MGKVLAGNVGGIGLDRHVLPVDEPAPVDADGFLDVPWAARSGSREGGPEPVADLIGQASGFVLLAAGGAGKSFVMDWLADHEPSALMVDLRTLTGPELRAEVRAAITRGGPVYLDALEDAASYEPAAFRILERELTAPAARSIRWRLACRPAAWDAGLAAALKSSFPGFRELRLLPLTRMAAYELVASAGVSAGSFLEALARARLGRLAASPQRLLAAAHQWASTGDLPESHVEAISFEVDRLLAETDRGRRQPSLPADRRRRLAARLGAITVFSGTARLARAAEAVPGLLGVADLPSEPEPDEPGTTVGPADYAEILGTAMFAAAPGASVEFQHQQYAEFLAAEYLVQRHVTRAQVRALLGVQADGLVPGPMIGVAAWLAALKPDLAEDLIARNALALAQAGIEMPSDDVRAAIVGGLLSAAASGDIDPERGLRLESLAYPGLKEQLARHLGDGPAQPAHLWWLAMLAADGRCYGLAPAFVHEAVSGHWPDWARRAAVTAVAVLGDDEELLQLTPLLTLGPEEDPSDGVLAAVIGTLYDALMSTADLLPVLRPQRSPGLNAYYDTLGKLPPTMPCEDLPAVLDWAAGRVPAVAGDGYGSFLSRLVTRAWAERADPGVHAALARLIAALARDPAGDTWASREILPWEEADPGRRDLAEATAAEIGTGRWHALLDFGLILPEDLSWLTGQLPAMPVAAHQALAACVPALVRHPTAAEADMILGLAEDHPAYEATRFLRDPVSTRSPAAAQWQEIHERTARDEDLRAATRAQRSEALAAALDDAQADPAAWWHVASWLSVTDRGQADADLFTGDLTARPGWALLDDHDRRRVLDLGIEYLAVHQPCPREWAGCKQIRGGAALPDWSGAYLLTTLVRYAPGRVRALDPVLWQTWAPAITGAWNHAEESDEQLRCDLIDLAPPEGRRHILDAALEHLDAINQHGGNLPDYLYQHLCPELAPSLADRLAAGRYSGQLALSLLSLLIEHAPGEALPVCRRLHHDPAPELASAARRGLTRLDPAAIVDALDSAATSPADLAEILPDLALAALDDAQLAVLAAVLLRCFPFARDPVPQFGWPGTDHLFQVRGIRNHVLERLTQGGQAGTLEKLARQSEDGADRDAISWYLRRARGRAAELALTRPDPPALLRLLGRADARLIRRASDLAEVLISQLEQVQHELTHQGASRDLWNFSDDSATPASEDDITDWLRRQLRSRLTIATTIDREVQVERGRRGSGTRIDLTVTAHAAVHPAAAVRVITEAKLVTNETLMTAMHDQLIRRYLVPTGLQHGIYLVYWIPPSQRKTLKRTHTDPGELLRELERQAASAGRDIYIRPLLLDITHK